VRASWPGNVRQLLNVVEQAVALSTAPIVPPTLVQNAIRELEDIIPFDEARRRFECDYLTRLLKMTGGNVAQAAKLAHRNRTDFYKLLQRHSMDPSLFK
jgi:two-component system response regulator GlrR